jgi:cob(I)alamin adenosyltransferase
MGKRLSKIYTRTGDGGETGLGDGQRISKSALRIAAIGDIDELNSWVGMLVEELLAEGDKFTGVADFLRRCQHRIFDLGGEVSIPGYAIVEAKHVDAIEVQLDALNADLPPLENFILPGGSRLIATIHLARSVCRRAERALVALAAQEEVNEEGLRFLNRLSDYLFVAARHVARVSGVGEVLWEK